MKSRSIWIVGVVALSLAIVVVALPVAAARVLEGMLRDIRGFRDIREFGEVRGFGEL